MSRRHAPTRAVGRSLIARQCPAWGFSKFPFDSSSTSTHRLALLAISPGFSVLILLVQPSEEGPITSLLSSLAPMVKSSQAGTSSTGDTPAAWNKRRKAEEHFQDGNGSASKKPRTRVRYGVFKTRHCVIGI